MSRILVADDNSNIQKMVALALKDEGIDVVAVGNGEAAMRKIPDLRPDLVLADIFMPVRNGYEVCEFVKSDSRYMSTPVVLLVGAFDPLDEQETQRVRADGVLKKPFVPPDPLINMVKALLAKSNGQKPVPMTTATPTIAATPTVVAPPMAPPPATPASPSSESSVATAEKPPQRQSKTSSSASEKPPASIAPPAPPQHAQPQTASVEDSDEVVTSARDPNLGEPFWATPAQPEEAQENAETDPKEMIDMHSFGKDEIPLEADDEPRFRPESLPLNATDFEADLGATTDSQNKGTASREAYVPQQTAASEYEINPTVEQSSEATSPSAPPETPVEAFQFDPALTFPAAAPDAPMEKNPDIAASAAPAEAGPEEGPGNEYAGSWASIDDSTAQPPARAEKPLSTHEQVEPMELELPPLPNHDAVITAATEAARLAFSELNIVPGYGGSGESSDRDANVTEQKDLLSPAPSSAPPANPEMIEAVVNRLLERMQPEIMEVVNREVLRPAIEAIVRREMKKS